METTEEFADAMGARLAQPCTGEDMAEAVIMVSERDAEQRKAGALAALALLHVDIVNAGIPEHIALACSRIVEARQIAVESGEWKP